MNDIPANNSTAFACLWCESYCFAFSSSRNIRYCCTVSCLVDCNIELLSLLFNRGEDNLIDKHIDTSSIEEIECVVALVHIKSDTSLFPLILCSLCERSCLRGVIIDSELYITVADGIVIANHSRILTSLWNTNFTSKCA